MCVCVCLVSDFENWARQFGAKFKKAGPLPCFFVSDCKPWTFHGVSVAVSYESRLDKQRCF